MKKTLLSFLTLFTLSCVMALNAHAADSNTPNGNVIAPMGVAAWNAKYVFNEASNAQEPAVDAQGKSWYMPDYDDSSWGNIVGGIGKKGSGGNPEFTEWEREGGTYFLRRTFHISNLQELYATFFMTISHDDGAKVYINGELVYNDNYNAVNKIVKLDKSHFKEGDNLLAIYVTDNSRGDQFIDCGISEAYTELLYTTTDNMPVELIDDDLFYDTDGNMLTVISNTYEDGQGRITISGLLSEFKDKNYSEHSIFGNTLKTMVLPNTIERIGDHAFGWLSNLESINLPEGLKSIGSQAFIQCKKLRGVSLPKSLERISSFAFQGDAAIKDVYISKTLTDIGYPAIAITGGSQSITVDPENPVFDSRDNCNAIIKTSTNTLLKGCCSTTIPSTVTELAEFAFTGYNSKVEINRVVIPSSVVKLGRRCFCDVVTKSLHIPSSVRYMGNEPFDNTIQDIYYEGSEEEWNQIENIQNVNLPEKVTLHFNSHQPQEATTNVSLYDNIVFFNDGYQWAGKHDVMKMMMNNTANVTAIQFDIVLPEGITLDKNAKGKYALTFDEETERTDATIHTLTSQLQPDGSIRMMCYSTDNEVILGNSGAVINFPISISEEMAPGCYNIILKNVLLTSTDKKEYSFDKVVCMYEISDLKKGDANKDSKINITDIVYTADYILGNDDPAFFAKAADMNDDNIINVTDIVFIAEEALHWNNSAAKAANSKAKSSAANDAGLTISPFNILSGNGKTVTLDMTNTGYEVTAFQCDIHLPEGITIDQNNRGKYKVVFDPDTERTDATCHTLSVAKQADDSIRILCYSVDLDAFSGENGAVVDIPLTADASMQDGEYELRIDNIVLTCTDKTQLTPSAYTTHVQVGNNVPTDIAKPEASSLPVIIYNANGQKQATMGKGINIIRMADGVSRKVIR